MGPSFCGHRNSGAFGNASEMWAGWAWDRHCGNVAWVEEAAGDLWLLKTRKMLKSLEFWDSPP
jgi:hypothetical protein